MGYKIGYVEEVSKVMKGIIELHDYILYYIIIVAVGITYIIVQEWRRSEGAGIKENRHSTITEIIWTIVPGIILVMIGIPSYKLLYIIDEIIRPEMTIKATGFQWAWKYNIEEKGVKIGYEAYTKKEISKGELRLLSTDNKIYIPKGRTIRILVTAEDVVHSFALPQAGVKVDGIPGRINSSWMKIEKGGVYYGQCSELCGINHSEMSIEIHAIPEKEYISYIISNSNISVNNMIRIVRSIKDLIS